MANGRVVGNQYYSILLLVIYYDNEAKIKYIQKGEQKHETESL